VPVTQRVIWDIIFDLSAPQILVPEQFVDRQALIMVLDFGKLYFANQEAKGDSPGTENNLKIKLSFWGHDFIRPTK